MAGPKTIEVTETDLTRISTLVIALKRGKWELEGPEILAFAQANHWVFELLDRVKSGLAKTEMVEVASPSSTLAPEAPSKRKKL